MGNYPEQYPLLGPVLAQSWADKAAAEGDRPFAVEGTRFRHSWAGECSRRLSYHLSGEDQTEPFDLATFWTFGIGNLLHNAWQEAAAHLGVAEETVHLPEWDTSGHIDFVVPESDYGKVAVEIKTISGFGYKKAIDGGGPRYNALVQGALNAHSTNADLLVILYLALESVSKPKARQSGINDLQRFCAEWHYRPEQFEPIALAELRRVRWVMDRVDSGQNTPRHIPDPDVGDGAAVILDPATGAWRTPDGKSGKTWHCGYCDFRTRCIRDGA